MRPFFAAFALLVALAPAPLFAQSLGDAEIEELERMTHELMKKENIPGLSIAVGRGGKFVYEQGFGYADLENHVAVKPETRFRTASIAKAITGVAAVRLAARGKLDLDAPIRTLVPAWPKKRWPVTTRQLLGHLGGVRHYAKLGESTGTRAFPTIASSLRLFSGDPLLHEPGTKYRYTTFGFTLVGLALEKAAGKDYMSVIQEEVLKPARMPYTVQDSQWALIRDRTRFYRRLGDGWRRRLPETVRKRTSKGQVVHAPYHDTSMKVPGGGLLSTSSDLVRLGLALMNGKLLDEKSLAAMWTSQKTKAGKTTGYGMGWGVGRQKQWSWVSHGGGQAGTTCNLILIPERKVAVAIMSNLQQAKSLGATAKKLAISLCGK